MTDQESFGEICKKIVQSADLDMRSNQINELVARKLGYQQLIKPGDCYDKAWINGVSVIPSVPNYCEEIEAAWEILTSFVETKGLYWSLGVLSTGMVYCRIGDEGGTEEAQASTAPMAICLAFLKLKEVERD